MATKRGSKLNKSETVQVRFDPVLKMAAELAAGKERRSLSSLIEWAVEMAAKQVVIKENHEGNQVTAWQVAQECWQSDPIQRIRALANHYPDLLTIRERKIIEGMKLVDTVVTEKDYEADTLKLLLMEYGQEYFIKFADDEITISELSMELHQLKIDNRYFERGHIGKDESDS